MLFFYWKVSSKMSTDIDVATNVDLWFSSSSSYVVVVCHINFLLYFFSDTCEWVKTYSLFNFSYFWSSLLSRSSPCSYAIRIYFANRLHRHLVQFLLALSYHHQLLSTFLLLQLLILRIKLINYDTHVLSCEISFNGRRTISPTFLNILLVWPLSLFLFIIIIIKIFISIIIISCWSVKET